MEGEDTGADGRERGPPQPCVMKTIKVWQKPDGQMFGFNGLPIQASSIHTSLKLYGVDKCLSVYFLLEQFQGILLEGID